MTLSRNTKSLLARTFAITGALPLAVGAGTVLLGGLSGAFNAMAGMNGLTGALALGAGAVLGGAAAVIGLYKAIDKGYFGRLDAVAGVVLLLAGGCGAAVSGGFLGATGASVIASYADAPAAGKQQIRSP
jgi:hypothetical protein